jgi:hypothetical protein
MTFGDIFSEINLDSSIIYVIILTNLIFLASKLGVPTLNIIWSFLNSMCPSMIRKLKVIVYFRKVFLLSKFKYFCFVTILDMSLISGSCKNDHISWTKWKSEATNPFLALRVYVKMSEIHETGGVRHKI